MGRLRHSFPSLAGRKSRGSTRGGEAHVSTSPTTIAIFWKLASGPGLPSELDRLAQEAETGQPSDPDPELAYYQGTIFASCGKNAAALHMLKTAVELNYCAYSNLLSDPLLRTLHSERKFDEVLTAAHDCQQAMQAASTPQSH